jgi:zinc protease
MFKGTAHPAGEFSQLVSRIGGNENAFTSYDYTAYYQRVSRDQLATMLAFEADRMTGLVLKDENVLPGVMWCSKNTTCVSETVRMRG